MLLWNSAFFTPAQSPSVSQFFALYYWFVMNGPMMLHCHKATVWMKHIYIHLHRKDDNQKSEFIPLPLTLCLLSSYYICIHTYIHTYIHTLVLLFTYFRRLTNSQLYSQELFCTNKQEKMKTLNSFVFLDSKLRLQEHAFSDFRLRCGSVWTSILTIFSKVWVSNILFRREKTGHVSILVC